MSKGNADLGATCEFLTDLLSQPAFQAVLTLRVIAEEAEVRRMLGRWVSEAEPAIARGPDGQLLGLCDAAVPVGVHARFGVRAWE